MKATDKIMIQVLIISAILTGGLYWWISDMHWGVYLGAWFVFSALGYSEWVKHAANEKQANQGDTAENR